MEQLLAAQEAPAPRTRKKKPEVKELTTEQRHKIHQEYGARYFGDIDAMNLVIDGALSREELNPKHSDMNLVARKALRNDLDWHPPKPPPPAKDAANDPARLANEAQERDKWRRNAEQVRQRGLEKSRL